MLILMDMNCGQLGAQAFEMSFMSFLPWPFLIRSSHRLPVTQWDPLVRPLIMPSSKTCHPIKSMTEPQIKAEEEARPSRALGPGVTGTLGGRG